MSRASEVCAAELQRRFGVAVSCDVVPVEGDPAELFDAERQLVARAVPSRQREFAAGRACARALLARLGFEPAALLEGPDGAPLWPRGAIGSIAHDARHCAVAVASARQFCALGLDIEPDEPLEEELWPELFLPNELAALALCSCQERGRVARVLFSAKECAYKCVHPLVGVMLGFHEVEIGLAGGSDHFHARVRHRRMNATLEGFRLVCSGSILTGMALSSTPTRPARRPAAALAATTTAPLFQGSSARQ